MKNYKRQTAILLSVFVLFCFLLQAPKPAKAEDLNLTGLNLKAYNLVKAEVLKIISGERKDTKIIITPEQLGLTKKYYAADIGLDAIRFTTSDSRIDLLPEVREAVYNAFPFDPLLVMNALFRNLPYGFFWSYGQVYFKSPIHSFSAELYESGSDKNCIFFQNNFEMLFSVGKDYTNNFVASGDNFSYSVDKGIPTAKSAMAAAKAIVAAAASLSDYEKLKYYMEKIIELTDYNNDAVKSTWDSGRRDPWQAVWVFDNDASTKVVCQGYAKAFQYLCDLTTFSSPLIKCRCASGNFEAPGANSAHMWNIVTMEDGKNYIVDVTSCDLGGSKYTSALFLAGAASGSPSSNYVIKPVIYDISYDYIYTYDDVTKQLFSDAKLTLSATSYKAAGQATPTQKPATPTPTQKPATPTPTPKPATPTPTPTATNTPTPVPATPTPTPVPATPTPTNTATPTPTNTSTPTSTPTEVPPTASPEPSQSGAEPTAEPNVTNVPTQGGSEYTPTPEITFEPGHVTAPPVATPGITDDDTQQAVAGLLQKLGKVFLIGLGGIAGFIVLIVVITIVVSKKK